MKDLLKEMLVAGALDSYAGGETTLAAILGSIHLLRKGAFAPSMRLLGTVSRWGVDEIGLIRRFVSQDRLLNAAADEHRCVWRTFRRQPAAVGRLTGRCRRPDRGFLRPYG
jgi:hypothetical protein